LPRLALEGLALEESKNGHFTKAELRRLLGFGTRYRLDGFLKAHNVAVFVDCDPAIPPAVAEELRSSDAQSKFEPGFLLRRAG
jgi:hypothetical protein